MKKLISLTLAILMVFSLAITAMADTEPTTAPAGTFEDTVGSITLNNLTLENGKPAATYKVYQILKLNSFDFGSGSYYYTYTNDAWKTFFTTGAGADYIQVNNDNLIEWKGTNDAERVAEFARIALAYAQANSIDATADTLAVPAEYTVTAEGAVVFGNLPLGYYLVDSSVGSLCGLTTTNPNGIINSKNGTPTLEKQVQEDLGGQWGKTNSADIGQDVNFRITIHVHDGAQDYILHDTMEAGFTFKEETVAVVVRDGGSGTEQTIAKAGNYEITSNDQSFAITFTDDFCDGLNTNDRLIVTYSAMLNRNAEIGNGTAENPSNENKAYLEFGEGHETPEDSTTTKTYGFDLVKTDGQNKLLDGSEFKIYDAANDGNEVTVVQMFDENGEALKTADGYFMYRKARADETGATVIVVKGKVRVIGLDNGIYFLEETKAPNGFNAITTRQKFTIADNNLDAIITGGIVSTNSGVQVVNHTGTMLPETGGMGTVLFITIGTILALGAGVVLVTKKRMANIAE
ncbi:MAG: SpaH/EbpB family LPXTG-anchored major pilin [Oscillospiraceae bacterium]|nr:SpaH/EbpB family LPXTG-anchored major pilin [Oscillospiraceae bacterium]